VRLSHLLLCVISCGDGICGSSGGGGDYSSGDGCDDGGGDYSSGDGCDDGGGNSDGKSEQTHYLLQAVLLQRALLLLP
jgi:hypothetical protein